MNISEFFQACRDNDITFATAESCTGGMLSTVITAISGASDVFDRGFVTYSDEAKHELLGVAKKLIKTHGAVSEQVAVAMAEGILKNSNANLGISITGVAGPDGGSDEKPVGTVYIGICREGSDAEATRHYFQGNRTEIRQQAAMAAMQILKDAV